jgi:hypothetical protein
MNLQNLYVWRSYGANNVQFWYSSGILAEYFVVSRLLNWQNSTTHFWKNMASLLLSAQATRRICGNYGTQQGFVESC